MDTEIHCYRHANAVKGPVDAERRLSDNGIAQTDARLRKTGVHGYGLVITSPALRAVETAATLASSDRKSFVIEPALYWGEDPDFNTAMDRMFLDLGYAPLEKYLAHNFGIYIVNHGAHAWAAVCRILHTNDANRVFVSGHAVLLQAMALAGTRTNRFPKEAHLRAILGVSLGEAEGFVLTVRNDIVVGINMIN